MDELTDTYNEIFSAIQQDDVRLALETLQAFAASVLMDSELANTVMSAKISAE